MRIQSKNRKFLTRENTSDQVATGFSFERDWLRNWRGISERSKAKEKKSRINFDFVENCSKTAVSHLSETLRGRVTQAQCRLIRDTCSQCNLVGHNPCSEKHGFYHISTKI